MDESERKRTTLPDLHRDDAARMRAKGQPVSVRKDTMWEARLILSTLDPRGIWAGRLRLAIRQGDRPLVDTLLQQVYEERQSAPAEASDELSMSVKVNSSRPVLRSQVLPPAPARRNAS
jgi:hypothetical protein